jgi:multidrug efflux system membrane fusion protein
MRTSLKSNIYIGFLLAGGVLVLTGCSGAGGAAQAAGKGGGGRGRGETGPVPVTVAKVSQKDVPIDIQVIGNVEAYATITIKAQVSGQVTDVPFHEGDFVKKNQRLFSIDPRPYEAQIGQIEANIERDKAVLKQAQANLQRDTAQQKYAEDQAERYAKLYDAKVMSKEQADQFRSNADALAQGLSADRAAIDSANAQINADQAGLQNAKVMLSYTDIRSPLDGQTGNLMVKQGNVVPANSTDLIAINQVEPIYVTFSVPEANLREVKRYMGQGKLQVMATTQDADPVTERGSLTFVDNNVDNTTGTIKLKGTFANSDHKLWPGQFVHVALRLNTQANALVVPNQAVQTGQDGTFVYVVKDGKAEFRPVKTGARVEQELVIAQGLEPGETVVTEGQLRLAPNSRVQIRDANGLPPGGGAGGGGRRGAGGTGGPGGLGGHGGPGGRGPKQGPPA